MALTRRPTATAAAVLGAGLLTGCTSDLSSPAMNPDDNLGVLACRDAVSAQSMEDGPERDELADAAAASAAAAETPALRQLVSPPVDEDQLERVGAEDRGLYSVDIDELVAVCADYGFDADGVELADSSD